MGREWVEFFLRESQFFRGKDWVLFVANIAGVTIENLLRRGGGGRGVVIRIVQSPPTHPQTLNNYRSLNPTRYQSEKNILHS